MRALSFLALLLVAGCASLAVDDGPDAASVEGIDTLAFFLEGRGFALAPAGLTSSTVPVAVTTTFRVSGPTSAVIEAYEFGSDAEAVSGLARLRAEVPSRVRQEVYASGPLVVFLRPAVYGRPVSLHLRTALREALGAPRLGA